MPSTTFENWFAVVHLLGVHPGLWDVLQVNGTKAFFCHHRSGKAAVSLTFDTLRVAPCYMGTV